MTHRIAFMGTPDFAVPALVALIDAGHEVARVYTQPPRPAGRGKKDRPSPVQLYAAGKGIEVRHPESLRDAAEQDAFAALELDIAVVAAYGLILPKAVLVAPRLGCLNIHASLLPRWRGAAPIQRAILAGDTETGVTIMQMDQGLDTGDMLLREAIPIPPEMTAGELHDALAAIGARMIVEVLAWVDGLTATPQPDSGVTYAAKIDKAETRLDWTRPAIDLNRAVRAFAPHPGAWFALDGERIKILAAEIADRSGEAGVTLDDALTVACGEGALRPVMVQRAGKAPMKTAAFLRGRPVRAETMLR